jgi:hypothetical protein
VLSVQLCAGLLIACAIFCCVQADAFPAKCAASHHLTVVQLCWPIPCKRMPTMECFQPCYTMWPSAQCMTSATALLSHIVHTSRCAVWFRLVSGEPCQAACGASTASTTTCAARQPTPCRTTAQPRACSSRPLTRTTAAAEGAAAAAAPYRLNAARLGATTRQHPQLQSPRPPSPHCQPPTNRQPRECSSAYVSLFT